MHPKIIAELSANHNHDINIARHSIKAAMEAGADAVKLQTYTPDTLTIDCDNQYFRIAQDTIWDGKTLYGLYQEAYTPWEWHKELFDYAHKLGIEIFSTPFNHTAVDLLEELSCPMYKIASFEITDLPLIEYTAEKGKPMIISVGIAIFEEIKEAVEACRSVGNNDITLLQCTSQYPARLEDANLAVMQDLKAQFDVKVGLSDHTMGAQVARVAAALGASAIEKHFILDRSIGGPDADFSLTPEEFKQMVCEIREVEGIIGKVSYDMTEEKRKSRTFSRSLFVVEDVHEGDLITTENVRSIRPGYGMQPKYLRKIIGKTFNKEIKKGTPLSWEFIND